jgi:hypothetical protein
MTKSFQETEAAFWEAFSKERALRMADSPDWWSGCDEALEAEMRKELGLPHPGASDFEKLAHYPESLGLGFRVERCVPPPTYSLIWKNGDSVHSPNLSDIAKRVEDERRQAS